MMILLKMTCQCMLEDTAAWILAYYIHKNHEQVEFYYQKLKKKNLNNINIEIFFFILIYL